MVDPSRNERADDSAAAHTKSPSVDSAELTDAMLIGLWQELGFPKIEQQDDRIYDWVVVAEFSAGAGKRLYDLDALDDLVEGLREWQPSALYNRDGYAVQLHVAAPTAPGALRLGLCRHDLTASDVGLTSLSLLRTEVLTLAEFEQSCQDQIDASLAPRTVSEHTVVPSAVYQATRDLLAATVPAQVSDTVVNFVLTVGGAIHLGCPVQSPDAVSVAIPIGSRQEMYATGDTDTVAGFMVEHWLPQLHADATATLARMALEHQLRRPS